MVGPKLALADLEGLHEVLLGFVVAPFEGVDGRQTIFDLGDVRVGFSEGDDFDGEGLERRDEGGKEAGLKGKENFHKRKRKKGKKEKLRRKIKTSKLLKNPVRQFSHGSNQKPENI
jgi:hypothetical protein